MVNYLKKKMEIERKEIKMKVRIFKYQKNKNGNI